MKPKRVQDQMIHIDLLPRYEELLSDYLDRLYAEIGSASEDAVIERVSCHCDDDPCRCDPCFAIRTYRDESQKEMENRIKLENKKKEKDKVRKQKEEAEKEKRELKEYERLRKKFEVKTPQE